MSGTANMSGQEICQVTEIISGDMSGDSNMSGDITMPGGPKTSGNMSDDTFYITQTCQVPTFYITGVAEIRQQPLPNPEGPY